MGRAGGRGQFVTRHWAPDFARTTGRRSAAGEYEAFIPARLAQEEPRLSSATSALAERAGVAVRALNQSATGLPSLEGLASQLLRSESLASSQIEGLSLSHRKLARAALEGHNDYRAQEVLANIGAMEEAVRIGKTADPITPADILAMFGR